MIEIQYVPAPGAADSDFVLISPKRTGSKKRTRGTGRRMSDSVKKSFGSFSSHSKGQHVLIFEIETDEGTSAELTQRVLTLAQTSLFVGANATNGQLPVVGGAAPTITSGGAKSCFRSMQQYRTNREECDPEFTKRVDSVREMVREHNSGWSEDMVLTEVEEFIDSCSNGNSQLCDHTERKVVQAIQRLMGWGMLPSITGVAMEGELQPCYPCAVQMTTVLVQGLALDVRYRFPKTVPLLAHNAHVMPASGTTATAYVPGGKTPGEVQLEMQRVLALFQQVVDELDQEHTAAPAPAAVAASYDFRPTTTTSCVDYDESSTCRECQNLCCNCLSEREKAIQQFWEH